MEKFILEYAKINGALQVWKSWRDTMLKQGREVNEKFMDLPIPERDMELDAQIAADVIDDFLVWVEAHKDLVLMSSDSIDGG